MGRIISQIAVALCLSALIVTGALFIISNEEGVLQELPKEHDAQGGIQLPTPSENSAIPSVPQPIVTQPALEEVPSVEEKKVELAPTKQPIHTVLSPPAVSDDVPPTVREEVTEMTIEEKTVTTPGPLIIVASATATATTEVHNSADVGAPLSGGALDQSGIFVLVNAERNKIGLSSLLFNKRLAAVAEAKVVDMIDGQYFAHVSPSGVDIGMLAEKYGYAYLSVGENLALGHFASSGDVMSGWMNSPGHRANILQKDFTEIGISALRGTYEGETVWFAVQEFGRPLPVCPKPDVSLKEKIVIFSEHLDALEVTLKNLKSEIDTPGIDRVTYNAKAADYNTIIALYNSTSLTTKADVETYNALVDVYNSCLDAVTPMP